MNLNKLEIKCVNEIIDVIVNSNPTNKNSWSAQDGNLTALIKQTVNRLFPKDDNVRFVVTKKMYILLVYPYE